MSNVTKEYDVSEIKLGNFVSWTVCTQACNASHIKLRDDSGNVYFEYDKPQTGSGEMICLGQGRAVCKGNKLKLVVTAQVTKDLYQSINSYNVTDNSARVVGHGYNFCFEDSLDNDFNDIYVNLIGWVKMN